MLVTVPIDRPALVHSLLKYKYLFGASKDDDKVIEMNSVKDDEKKEPEKPEKKKPLEV